MVLNLFANSYWGTVLALALVLGFVPMLKAAAPALGLLDKPDERKVHEGAVPLIGGLVVFPVFILVSILTGYSVNDYWPLYSAIILLLLTGAVDDKIHLHPFIKFGIQFVAAALVVIPGGAELKDLGDLFGFGIFSLGWMSIPFSVVAMVLLINAINLMDGLDGLAGGTGFIILGWFLYGCAMHFGGSPFALQIAVLMACLMGFLFYNMRSPWRKKANIFMGDAGSLCLGLMVGWYAIHLSPVLDQSGARVLEPMSVAWVLAIPIWDECAQFYRRVCEGRHPFSPDRGHFHHHFVKAGLPAGKAALMVHAFVFVTGWIGVSGFALGLPLPALTISWMVLILAHMAYSKTLDRYPVLIQRLGL